MTQANFGKMDFFEKTGYVFGLYKPSWEAFKINWATIVILWLLPIILLLALIPFLVLPLFTDNAAVTATSVLIAVLAAFGVLLLYLLILPAVTITQIQSVKGNKINVDTALKSSKDIIFKFIAATLLVAFITVGPLLLSIPLILVIVGLFLLPFAIAWAFVAPFFLALVPYLIVTEQLGPVEAIKKSVNLVKVHWQWVLAVVVVLLAINIVVSVFSFIPILGFVVSVAAAVVYYCMPAYVYVNHIQNTQAKSNSVTAKSPSKKPAKKSTKKAGSAKKK